MPTTEPTHDFSLALEKQIESLKSLKTQLEKSTVEAKTTQNQLQNESSSVTKFLADNVFRTDNPQRKTAAINALGNLITTLEQASHKADLAIDDAIDLNLIVVNMREWTECVKTLIPVIKVQIAIPTFSDVFSQYWDYIIGIATAINTALIGAALGTGPIGWTAVAIGIAVEALLVLIGGIIAGEERKASFENIKRQADESRDNVQQEVIDKLDRMHVQVNEFYSDLAKALNQAGLADAALLSKSQIVQVINNQIATLRQWRVSYQYMVKSISARSTPLQTAAQQAAAAIAPNDQARQTQTAQLLIASYLFEQGKGVLEVSDELDLPLDTVKCLQARALLMEGQTPAQIAQALAMSEADVLQVKQRTEQLDQALVDFDKVA